MWPTSATRDHKGTNSEEHLARERGHHDQLPNAVKMEQMWPTPCSRGDDKGGPVGLGGGQGAKEKLKKMVGKDMQKKMSCGSLNPAWVELLMGYPPDWTTLGDQDGKMESLESQKAKKTV